MDEKKLAIGKMICYTCIKGGVRMNMSELPRNEEEKIVLPKEIQIEMMQFFLRTSIPRKKQMMEEQKKLEEKTLSHSKSE